MTLTFSFGLHARWIALSVEVAWRNTFCRASLHLDFDPAEWKVGVFRHEHGTDMLLGPLTLMTAKGPAA